MKVTKISAITLPVSDMKKSVDFYSKIPNFKIVYGGPDSQFTSFLIEDGEKSYLNLKLDEARLPVGENSVLSFRFRYDFTVSSIRNEVNWASGPP